MEAKKNPYVKPEDGAAQIPSEAPCYTHVDLFSGIGGFSLGLERTGGFKTTLFCEVDPFCRKVIKKHWPNVPVHDDIRTLNNVTADIITGGFPCQPFSKAGKQKGSEDDRNLWPEMFRVIKQAQPTWVLCENVIDLEYMGLDKVLADLESQGYTTQSFIVPAGAVQRSHARERLWIVAYNERTGAKLEEHTDSGQIGNRTKNTQRKVVSQRYWKSCAKRLESSRVFLDGETFSVNGQSEPLFLGGTSRIPDRMDRRKTIGNSVVPQIPEILGAAILAV